MTFTYLSLAAFAALCFYLGSPHQRLWSGAAGKARPLRTVGCAGTVASLLAAITQLGPWAGAFSALTMLMAMLVLLPYLDALRRLRKPRQP